MSTRVLVPTLGEAISEAVLTAWLFSQGDPVRRGDEIAELETDKATLTLESPANGVLLSILVPQGTTVTPGQVLAWIGKPGEAVEVEPEPSASESAGSLSRSAQSLLRGIVPNPEDNPGVDQPASQAPAQTWAETLPTGEKEPRISQRVSPAARRLARQLGVELAEVSPGRVGRRITSEDVESYVRSSSATQAAELDKLPFHRIQMSRIQKTAAARMTESAQQIPQFSVSLDADATRLLEVKGELAGQGLRASITAMLIQLAARVLKLHPLLNARFDGDGILAYETVNIGIATASPAGLVAPVIHRAETLSLAEIARQLTELAGAGRENRLSLDQVSGATFTLSNLGMYGVQQFIPLVNPPQAAILGVGAARLAAQPSGEGGFMTVWLLNLSVSADHRVLDGEAAAQFLASLRTEIEKAEFIL
jgi:pyruvate dehydrogenase E2 component (dihydrolipoamide acetyltransferase)